MGKNIFLKTKLSIFCFVIFANLRGSEQCAVQQDPESNLHGRDSAGQLDAQKNPEFNLEEPSRVFDKNLEKNHFVIITPSYKNAGFIDVPGVPYKMRTCEFNIKTVMLQEGGDFTWEMKVIDDKSPDRTGYYVNEYVNQHDMGHKISVQINETRKLALHNLWEAINSCKDEDIILILDGDDGLAHPKVLQFLNEVYKDKNVWITYGQYKELHSGELGFNKEMPQGVVLANTFRFHPTIPTHLRTFKAWLAKRIKPEHLKVTVELGKRINTPDKNYIGDYFPMTYDMALMLPMMEMASKGHFRFIPDVLYWYNDSNPISDHRVNKSMQRAIDLYIRHELPIYTPLESKP